jgi:hypothetical protein
MTQIIWYLHKIYRSELIHCADINLCHSDLFPSQTELRVIGHHHTVRSTYSMPDRNSKSSDILSNSSVKDILRPGLSSQISLKENGVRQSWNFFCFCFEMMDKVYFGSSSNVLWRKYFYHFFSGGVRCQFQIAI